MPVKNVAQISSFTLAKPGRRENRAGPPERI